MGVRGDRCTPLPPKGCGYRLLGILGNCFCYYLQCVLDAAVELCDACMSAHVVYRKKKNRETPLGRKERSSTRVFLSALPHHQRQKCVNRFSCLHLKVWKLFAAMLVAKKKTPLA